MLNNRNIKETLRRNCRFVQLPLQFSERGTTAVNTNAWPATSLSDIMLPHYRYYGNEKMACSQ